MTDTIESLRARVGELEAKIQGKVLVDAMAYKHLISDNYELAALKANNERRCELGVSTNDLWEAWEELAALKAGQGEPGINVEPDAWASKIMCVGPNYGKTRYDKLPVQSLNPLHYTHEKLYSEKAAIGLMKAAYYNGYTQAPTIPEGWQLVPIEPTGEMVEAGCDQGSWEGGIWVMSATPDIYKAMLSASKEYKP